MPDRQLSTRDLATPPDRDDPDSLLGSEQPSEPAAPSDDVPRMRESTANGGGDPSDDIEAPASGHVELRGPATPTAADEREPLLPPDQSERFTTRWHEIQSSFVDQPRDAVADADALVADLMQRLAASFSNERDRLEGQWDRGDDVSTEDLRVALTRYRSFFDRLLSA